MKAFQLVKIQIKTPAGDITMTIPMHKWISIV